MRLEFADEIEVRVEKLVTGGEGLARWHGIPVFIPRSAPGDLLVVRLTERRPDYGRAEILQILEAGEGRREPPCPYFGRCGGCDLQHLEDELQTGLRALSVQETLVRLGGIRAEKGIGVIQGQPWAYRQKAQVHTEQRGQDLRVGFRARGSRRVVAIDQCPILVPELEDVLSRLHRMIPLDSPRRIDLLAGDDERISAAPRTDFLPHGEVSITTGDTVYELDARCFFQIHRGLLAQLIDCVVGDWRGERAYDLYAGVGFFALPLGRRYASVLAVEEDRIAARFLQRNARRNHLTAVDFVHSAVESWIEGLPKRADRVVVDPPRPGLPAKVRDLLCDRTPTRLTYVSCHPAALARDLACLRQAFEIERITAVDLFPQTGHMEVVVQLIS